MMKEFLHFITTALSLLLILATALTPAVNAATNESLRSLYLEAPFYDASSGNGCAVNGSTVQSSIGGGLRTGSAVYILGDSITVGASNEYTKAFQAKGLNVVINASTGRSIDGKGTDGDKLSGMEAVNEDRDVIANPNTKVIIIALGTNGGNTAQSIKALYDAIHEHNSAADIYWIDTTVIGKPSYLPTIRSANQAIYNNHESVGYKTISWFKTVTPEGDPVNPTGNEQDVKGLINQADSYNVHPTAAGNTALANLVVSTLTTGASASPLIVLDPGHIVTPPRSRIIDNETGIDVTEDTREFETKNVWDIAMAAKTILESAGYRVVLTRDTYENSNVTLKSRAQVANGVNAALAISIHTTGTASSDPNAGNEVFYQKTGRGLFKTLLPKRYLELPSPRPTNYDYIFTDANLEAKSLAAAQTLAQKMSESGVGTAKVSDTANSLRGSIWTVQYFANVPWIYAEVGSMDGVNSNNIPLDRQQKYTTAIVEAVKTSVPASTVSIPTNNNCFNAGNFAPLPGNNNAEKVWNFLLGKGLTPVQIAGIMGNLQAAIR
jgi:N-acetylmuramoyl-L-alanine amidase